MFCDIFPSWTEWLKFLLKDVYLNKKKNLRTNKIYSLTVSEKETISHFYEMFLHRYIHLRPSKVSTLASSFQLNLLSLSPFSPARPSYIFVAEFQCTWLLSWTQRLATSGSVLFYRYLLCSLVIKFQLTMDLQAFRRTNKNSRVNMRYARNRICKCITVRLRFHVQS